MSVIVLVPAAGMGRRMGSAVNKQYLELAGRPILAHTLARFDGHPLIDRIYVIVPAAEIDYCRREVVARYGFGKVRQVVAGGAERQDSVALGLAAAAPAATDVVLVHDGARPLFDPSLIPVLVEKARTVGGCVLGRPVKDTVKLVRDGRIESTPPRDLLWQAQTPQAFPAAVLRQAHERAAADGFRGTDDASLVERLGMPVVMHEGRGPNLKITTPEDLVLARALLAAEEPS